MSSKQSEPPLHLQLRSSRQLAMALLLIHGALMVAVLNLSLPPWGLIGLASAVIVSLLHTFNHHVMGRGARSVCSMLWDSDGEWSLMTCRGHKAAVSLAPSSYVHPRFMLLNFASREGEHYNVPLLTDSLDDRTFRKLVIRLRFETSRGDEG